MWTNIKKEWITLTFSTTTKTQPKQLLFNNNCGKQMWKNLLAY
jgi:hypothetical protein